MPETTRTHRGYEVYYYTIFKGTGVVPSATVGLSLDDSQFMSTSSGEDGIDAVCNVVDKITRIRIPKRDRRIVPDGSSTAADGNLVHKYTATVRWGGKKFSATGHDFEPERAALSAYLRAQNQIRSQDPSLS